MRYLIVAALFLISCNSNKGEIRQTEIEIELTKEKLESTSKWIKREGTEAKGRRDSAYFAKRIDSLQKRLIELR